MKPREYCSVRVTAIDAGVYCVDTHTLTINAHIYIHVQCTPRSLEYSSWSGGLGIGVLDTLAACGLLVCHSEHHLLSVYIIWSCVYLHSSPHRIPHHNGQPTLHYVSHGPHLGGVTESQPHIHEYSYPSYIMSTYMNTVMRL